MGVSKNKGEQIPKSEQVLVNELKRRWQAYKGDAERKTLNLGETLNKLQVRLAKNGRGGKFSKYLREVGVPRSTAYKLIEVYLAQLEDQRDAQISTAKTVKANRRTLEPAERRLFDARLCVRKAVNDVADNQKLEVLRDAIAEEAFETWGITKPFTLEIAPRRSTLTLDGQRRTSETEVTAA